MVEATGAAEFPDALSAAALLHALSRHKITAGTATLVVQNFAIKSNPPKAEAFPNVTRG